MPDYKRGSHDSDLLNTANKHIKHFKHKQEWLRRFDMTSQQLAIYQHQTQESVPG